MKLSERFFIQVPTKEQDKGAFVDHKGNSVRKIEGTKKFHHYMFFYQKHSIGSVSLQEISVVSAFLA